MATVTVVAVIVVSGSGTLARGGTAASVDTVPSHTDEPLDVGKLLAVARGEHKGDYLVGVQGTEVFSTAPPVKPQVGWNAGRHYSGFMEWRFEVLKNGYSGTIVSSAWSVSGIFKLVIPSPYPGAGRLSCSGPISMTKQAASEFMSNLGIYAGGTATTRQLYPDLIPGPNAGLGVTKCGFSPTPGWATKTTISAWNALTRPPVLTIPCSKPTGTPWNKGGTVSGFPEEGTVGIGKLTITVNTSIRYSLIDGCSAD